MRKFFIVIATLLGIVLLAAILLPIVFKDDIQKTLDEELANNLNAKVFYDVDQFGLSLFSDFPNLTLNVGNFGIAGVEDFEGDTLASIGNFQLSIDIMSVISGDQVVIKKILLDQPNIMVIVLENGKANYDIAKSTSEESAQPEEEPDTSTESSTMSISIDQWEIRDGEVVYYDLSLPFYATLQDLQHIGSGDFASEVFDMTTSTSIENLSLGYDGVDYISDKHFQVDIIMAMDLANMKFTFKENTLSMNDFGFGFDGFVSMPGEDIDMDITLGGREIDLADILSLIPGVYQEYLDGVSASADISFSGSVKGTYNDQSMPAIAGEFGIENGAIKYLEYPVPIEKLSLGTSFDYPSADLKETSFSIDHFSMLVDGEEVNASLFFKDLEDYYWDFKMEGNLDLEKLTKIIPLEGMELEGKIAAGLQTSGRMSDLEAERYDKLPTQGDLSIEGFEYQSVDLPQGFGITSASASLNPSVISLSQFSGHAGRTDLNLSGDIKNYLQFALGKDEPLQGNFAFKSSIVDLNEWMAEEDTTAVVAEEADTAALEVVRIPANVDFVLASSIDKIIYDNLTLNEFAGKVIIKDGALRMQRVNFDLLDGYFEMNGAYETLPEEPTYDFDFKIKDLSIPQAFQSFTSIKQMVPVAERMNGKFSTDFQIGGSLLEDMMPNYDNMKGSGLVEVAQASLADVKLLSAVSSLTSLDNQDGKVTLKDVIMQTEVRDGRVFVKPFDVTLAGYTTTISGSNGIAGDLDYIFTMREVSTGLVGQAVSSLISSIGGSKKTDTKIDINLGVTGNYDEPKVKLLSSSTSKGAAGSATKAVVKSQKEAVTKRISEEKKVVQDSVKSVVTEKKKEVEKQANKEVEKAKEKAKSALKGLIKRRKN